MPHDEDSDETWAHGLALHLAYRPRADEQPVAQKPLTSGAAQLLLAMTMVERFDAERTAMALGQSLAANDLDSNAEISRVRRNHADPAHRAVDSGSVPAPSQPS